MKEKEETKSTEYPAIAAGYKHPEAFCHMLYQCGTCGYILPMYNAKDGVTPFLMSCANLIFDCKGEMSHIQWRYDKFDPNYVPNKGDWLWISMTEEIARIWAKRRLLQFESSNHKPPCRGTKERRELEDVVTEDIYGKGQNPLRYFFR